MKKILLILLSVSCFSATAIVPTWQELPKENLPGNTTGLSLPVAYTAFRLQTEALKNQLLSLPASAAEAKQIAIPMPDGRMRRFRVWEAPMLAPALSAAYPDIKTYDAVAVDDPTVTAKFDITLLGFHGMIYDGANTYLVDPYNKEQNVYFCYYKKDLRTSSLKESSCAGQGIEEDGPLQHKSMQVGNGSNLPPMQLKTNGDVRRSYRLALACTGEYSVAVAGTSTPSKALSLSAMTTTMNRVNGVYEREVNVHMEIIATNDDIIYLDGTTDPFTGNFSGGILKGENQENTDTVIGTLNYDIGHIFSTGLGGIAELGSVCEITSKAEGVTGQPNPTGDAFAIDFVAHEMGHQFGATHSFNANTSACNGNGASISSYEPGSGSTIMGYAGICGAGNNLQSNSDDYFHAASLGQIAEFIADITGGGLCAVATPSGNTAPSIPSIAQAYTIPYLTPFELEAPEATDADHDEITYCWEEWDLGDFKASFDKTRVYGPIFRSLKPTTSRWRVFPTLDTLRKNITSYLGEKLPDTSRTLRFKLTVRDMYNGHGAFQVAEDVTTLNVVHTAGPFKISMPNGYSDYWVSGATATVTWDVANTTAAPVNCSNVNIYLSIDDGVTYPYTLASNTPNDGSETVNVPAGIYAEGCRVKVKGAGNVFFDINDIRFPIFPWPQDVSNVDKEDAILVYPIPAKDMVTITGNGTYNAIVINSIGQQLWSGNIAQQASIDTKGWASGIYYLHLTDADKHNLVKKLVIQ